MFGNLGAGEIVLIVLVILLLFGAKKLKEFPRIFSFSEEERKGEGAMRSV